MKGWLLALALCLLCWQSAVHAAFATEPRLVLVASARSAIAQLPAAEVRKLYLGIPLFADEQTIKPLRNNSNDYLQEVFMQKVMYMSTPAYERQIISRVFRTGGTHPPVYTNLHELVDMLQTDPSTVSYMSRDDAHNHPELKIISDLSGKQE